MPNVPTNLPPRGTRRRRKKRRKKRWKRKRRRRTWSFEVFECLVKIVPC